MEIDLTSPTFESREIVFPQGDIRQFSVVNSSVYSVNCKGLLQVFDLKTGQFSVAEVPQSENLLVDNFTVSPDEKILALAGSESRMSQKPRQVVLLLEARTLKKLATTTLKEYPQSPSGAVKKMLFLEKGSIRLLAAVTDDTCGLHLFEVKEKELRLICTKDRIHQRSLSSHQNTSTTS